MPVWCAEALGPIFTIVESREAVVQLPEKAQHRPDGKAYLHDDESGFLTLVDSHTGRHPTMYTVVAQDAARHRFVAQHVPKPHFPEDCPWAYDFVCKNGPYVFMYGYDIRAARIDFQSVPTSPSATTQWLPCTRTATLEDGTTITLPAECYHTTSQVAPQLFLGCVVGTVVLVSFKESEAGICLNEERVWPYAVNVVANALGHVYAVETQQEYLDDVFVRSSGLYRWSIDDEDDEPLLLLRTAERIGKCWASTFVEGLVAFRYGTNELCVLFPDKTTLRYNMSACACDQDEEKAHELQYNDGPCVGGFLSERWFVIADTPHSLLWVDLANKCIAKRYIFDVPADKATKEHPNYAKLVELRTECEQLCCSHCTFQCVLGTISNNVFSDEVETLSKRMWSELAPTEYPMCKKCDVPLTWSMFSYCPKCGGAGGQEDSSGDEGSEEAQEEGKEPNENLDELAGQLQRVQVESQEAEVEEHVESPPSPRSIKDISCDDNVDAATLQKWKEQQEEEHKFYEELEKRAEKRALESILGFKLLDSGMLLVARRVLLQVYWTRLRVLPASSM